MYPHVGILFNELPGRAGLSFTWSSDCFHPLVIRHDMAAIAWGQVDADEMASDLANVADDLPGLCRGRPALQRVEVLLETIRADAVGKSDLRVGGDIVFDY